MKIFYNRFFLAILCVGIIAFSSSLIAVHILNLSPCTLCKLQRIPHALLISNALFGLISRYKTGFFKVILAVLGFGVILSTFHLLMQVGVVPDFCSSQRGFTSTDEFLQILQSPKCSQVNWSIWGIPVSLLNALLHGTVLGISVHYKAKKTYIRGAQ